LEDEPPPAAQGNELLHVHETPHPVPTCRRPKILSPGGATVVSQGREPLVANEPIDPSPGGATVRPALSPLRGYRLFSVPVQGLTPLANNGRPFGAQGRARPVGWGSPPYFVQWLATTPAAPTSTRGGSGRSSGTR